MSRIPASPHTHAVTAPLPITSQPLPSAKPSEAQANASGKTSGAKPADQLTVDPAKQGASSPHIAIDMDGLLTDEVVTPVSEQELKVAMALEEKVVKGYQPTSEEFAVYQDVVQRINANNPARQMPHEHHHLLQNANVTQAELDFALGLEERVLKGYTPTEQDTQDYENVLNRLAEAQQKSSSVSMEDQNWAVDLMDRIQNKGETATPEDIERYTRIYEQTRADIASAAEEAPAVSAPSSEELNWAMELESKVKTQSYEPTAEERAKYTNIYERYQAAQ